MWDQRSETQRQQHRIANLEARIDFATDMLCRLGQEVERMDSKILTHKFPDIGNWYYSHRQSDAAREEREQQEKQLAVIHKKRMIEDLKKEIAALENM
jgi:predicted RNase H-like nuclease (RuvC/YqgF family)